MSRTGQKPGKGTYECTRCGKVLVLDEKSATLPPCPRCHGTEFRP
jgi:phage FluMu protein Com